MKLLLVNNLSSSSQSSTTSPTTNKPRPTLLCLFLNFGEYLHLGLDWEWCHHGLHECGIRYTSLSLAIDDAMHASLSCCWQSSAPHVRTLRSLRGTETPHTVRIACCRPRLAMAYTVVLAHMRIFAPLLRQFPADT